MEIPTAGRVVKSIAVKVGDKVAEGAVVLEVEAADAAAAGRQGRRPRPTRCRPKPPRPRPSRLPAAPAAATFKGSADAEYDMLVLLGPGGYRRLPCRRPRPVRGAGRTLRHAKWRLPERGCISSKALLHNAAIIDEARELAAHGTSFGEPKIDLDKLLVSKDSVVAS